MSTYRFTNRRVYRHRSEQRRRRLRWMALVLTGLLMVSTVAMMWGNVRARLSRTVVSVPVAQPFTGTAAKLGVGGR